MSWHRRLRMERLENRLTLDGHHELLPTWYEFDEIPPAVDPNAVYFSPTDRMREALGDESRLEVEALLTTTAAPANYVTGTGGGLDGVARLDITTSIGNFLGSGTLLPTGRHVLSAAHNFTDGTGGFLGGTTDVTFELPNNQTETLRANGIVIHPNWNGMAFHGADIAILFLPEAAPVGADRFDVYRPTDEVFQTFQISGYGRTGTGLTGDTQAAGIKRDGSNRVEGDATLFEQIGVQPGVITPGTQVLLDFDSGNAANDAAGIQFDLDDLGVGVEEVMNALGDSGGPWLLDDRIAGVISYRATDNGAHDALPGSNSSFGEYGGATRVSTYAPWIDTVIDIIGPRVFEVTISGTNSPHDPYSFSEVVGSGDQIRTIKVGSADTFEITFSEEVNLTGNELTLQSAITSSFYSLDYQGLTNNTATWQLSSGVLPLLGDQIILTLDDSVEDTGGVALDGEWTNPTSVTATGTSEFPSGNGVAGGDFAFNLAVLPGDFDWDGRVLTADQNLVLDYWVDPVPPLPPGWDGYPPTPPTVGIDEQNQVSDNWGKDFTNWPSSGSGAASGSLSEGAASLAIGYVFPADARPSIARSNRDLGSAPVYSAASDESLLATLIAVTADDPEKEWPFDPALDRVIESFDDGQDALLEFAADDLFTAFATGRIGAQSYRDSV